MLRVDGRDLSGWTSVQIIRALDQLADTFDLAISTSRASSAEIVEGAACEVIYRGEKLISGYIDDVDLSDTSTSSSLSVSGRSRAGDLVDCSAIHKPWRKRSGLEIARDICKPFGISVDLEIATGTLGEEGYFKIEDGETVFDVLDRLARLNGARLCSYPDGSIRFTRTGLLHYPDVLIARGINIASAHVRRSMAQRFSDYVFKAQLAADDETFGEAVAIKYEVRDDAVPRHRPLVVQTETQPRNTKGQFVEGEPIKHPLQLAATWERNTRAGKSLQMEYVLVDRKNPKRSWEHARGVWEPNIVVAVEDDVYGIDGEFLVTQVTMTRDSAGGTRTQVTLTPPEAYDVKVPPKRKKPKGEGSRFDDHA
ncbi:hypothetical protein OV079_23735 [Nannocystis pusilla]|uniref:Mu P family protein n=1 Tax=Nannocystis pusilla TaxID=889268 RepID=A0A9X3ESE1_9BACT|nr:hypothetical protein [Nannocystis pusilla]MCY1008514.1 hypothetical protein [Nannocystis pusilla]